MQRASLAWLVHLYTAGSAVLGAYALLAVFAGDFRRAWLLLAITIVIDSTDGWLARSFNVKAVLPYFDGRRLDDIVDYLCWVFIPALLLVRAGILPAWAAVAPILASCYGFAQVAAKTDDDFFLGFPSYWSIVGFYLYEFAIPESIAVPVILALSVLVFVPLRYPYPTRTRAFRRLTLTLALPWAALGLALILALPNRPAWAPLLYYYPLYYTVLTIVLWFRRRATPACVRSV
ncbi:MAG: CDP-alcohol phosphatidyltransferase family protein [Thermomicrobiales bacterium]